MRAALAAALLLTLASRARADLGDVDTSLGEISFEEVQVSPDGRRLAFISRRNDFERDREAFTLWMIDLARPAAQEEAPHGAAAALQAAGWRVKRVHGRTEGAR